MIETAKMDCTNPFFKSKYADLGAVWDAVRAALKANGLAVSQFPDNIGQEPALTTILMHESGDWIKATYPLVVGAKDETAQGYGSAITYARRYGLSAVLGVIADEDDDGNAASKPAPKPKVETVPTPTPEPIPTVTPAEWTRKAIDRVKGFKNSKELGEFEEKYHAKIAKIRPVEPDLHAKLIDTIREKYVVFAS